MRALVVLAVLAGTAHADPPAQIATDPQWTHPHAGLGMTLGFGPVGEFDRTSGWAARLAYGLYPALAPRGEVGGVFGLEPAIEYWRAGKDSGFGMPVMEMLGIRGPGFRAALGVGLDMFLIDDVENATGVGFLAPIAGANVGVDLFGVRIAADAQIERRWLIGADDHTQWKLVLVAGYTWERELGAPYL